MNTFRIKITYRDIRGHEIEMMIDAGPLVITQIENKILSFSGPEIEMAYRLEDVVRMSIEQASRSAEARAPVANPLPSSPS